MDIKNIAQERLNGPEWIAFLEGLGIAIADRGPDDEAFWRAVDYAKGPLFEGIADEDAEQIEAAVQAELAARGIEAP